MSCSCSTVAVVRPRVWMGCLGCYNAGRLVGRWVDAESAASLTSEELHGYPSAHDELWCLDTEGFPYGTGEVSPSVASKWGELYAEVGETHWPALVAWVESGCYVVDSEDLPCVSDFEERFCGSWDCEMDFANQLAEDLGIWREVPEHLHSYVDVQKWWRDERLDYTVVNAPDGGVYVFRCC
ncbi:MAG: antirestriction protein ArdA [Schaalia hyovaginalis]|nr:antirestriction protein ArdA [Schaalia hyovaginalis]